VRVCARVCVCACVAGGGKDGEPEGMPCMPKAPAGTAAAIAWVVGWVVRAHAHQYNEAHSCTTRPYGLYVQEAARVAGLRTGVWGAASSTWRSEDRAATVPKKAARAPTREPASYEAKRPREEEEYLTSFTSAAMEVRSSAAPAYARAVA